MRTRRGDDTTHRELTRWSRMIRACAAALDTRPAEGAPGAGEAPPQVLVVRRLLFEAAADLDRHAHTLRRLDDEIDLLRRRARPADAPHLHDLERRRARSEARLQAVLDTATRALVPGGDALDPATILRRLSGPTGTTRFSYFGRPAVDRGARLRRLSALLLRGSPPARPRTTTGQAVVVLPPRSSRLSPVHARLLRSVPPAPLSGVAS